MCTSNLQQVFEELVEFMHLEDKQDKKLLYELLYGIEKLNRLDFVIPQRMKALLKDCKLDGSVQKTLERIKIDVDVLIFAV